VPNVCGVGVDIDVGSEAEVDDVEWDVELGIGLKEEDMELEEIVAGNEVLLEEVLDDEGLFKEVEELEEIGIAVEQVEIESTCGAVEVEGIVEIVAGVLEASREDGIEQQEIERLPR
jgi:hypothetical protein